MSIALSLLLAEVSLLSFHFSTLCFNVSFFMSPSTSNKLSASNLIYHARVFTRMIISVDLDSAANHVGSLSTLSVWA
jgi:hypothetical protein